MSILIPELSVRHPDHTDDGKISIGDLQPEAAMMAVAQALGNGLLSLNGIPDVGELPTVDLNVVLIGGDQIDSFASWVRAEAAVELIERFGNGTVKAIAEIANVSESAVMNWKTTITTWDYAERVNGASFSHHQLCNALVVGGDYAEAKGYIQTALEQKMGCSRFAEYLRAMRAGSSSPNGQSSMGASSPVTDWYKANRLEPRLVGDDCLVLNGVSGEITIKSVLLTGKATIVIEKGE